MRKTKDFEAYIDDYNLIVIYVKINNFHGFNDIFYLSSNKSQEVTYSISSREVSTNDYMKFRLTLEKEIAIGDEYEIMTSFGKRYPVCYGSIVKTERFDKEFSYGKNDLGASYSFLETKFVVWSPVASEINLIVNRNNKTKDYPLKKSSNGVFRGKVKADLSGCQYKYLVKINGGWNEVIDPYAKSLSTNGKWGVIIDPKSIKVENVDLKLTDNLVDHVIYEISVRDMTSSLTSNVKNRMLYLGLTEEGTSYKDYPTALAHIKSLGVTMVQLMPVYDFSTVDEFNINKNYNWGYDPNHYMALEGGFSSDPEDGYSRVREFKSLVSTFHKSGLAVSIDLVYNHVFDMEANSLWKLIPSYFFRMSKSGAISNGSFCGNDYESQTYMGRKYLVDCCINWVKMYDVDAFRMDLMGIIDVKTINLILSEIRKIKPNFMIYGEGWNMPTMLPDNMKSTIANNLHLPDIGFFNDRFRDTVKGSTSTGEESVRGYASNDISKIEIMKNVLSASIVDYGIFPYVSNPNQTINYVACHDNQTLWDKLKGCCKDEPREQRILRQKLINACILIAQGVPFLHCGQEYCRTKHLDHNSYNSGDQINMVDYNRINEFRSTVDYTISMIKLRKDYSEFRLKTKEEIERYISFINLENGILLYRIDTGSGRVVDCLINPTRILTNYEYSFNVRIIADIDGYHNEGKEDNIIGITPISVVVVEYGK